MLSKRIAQQQPMQPVQGKFFYGWLITAMAGLGVFFSGPGQTYSVSVFIDSYMKEFSWSSSTVSGVYSIATLCAGSVLFIVGRLVDRYGQRAMSVGIGILFALACFWNSAIAGTVMLFLGFFMIRLFGQGSMTLIPNTLVPQWFVEKRGKALSLMAIGGFLSSALLPLLNAWLIQEIGWRLTWRVWGTLLLVIFVPLAYLFIRNKPEDIGLLPDGEKITISNDKQEQVKKFTEKDWTLKEAMKTYQFWLILFCVSIPAMVNTGITFHLVTIFGESGLKTTTAAFVLSIMAIVGFPLTFLSGYLVDRISVHYLLAITFLGHVISMIFLQSVHTMLFAVIYGVIWGMISGFERITLNIVWPNYFGRKYLGSIKGIAMTSMVIGSAFGPLPFGLAYDYFGGYKEIIYIMMAFPLLGAIAAWLSPPPKAGEF